MNRFFCTNYFIEKVSVKWLFMTSGVKKKFFVYINKLTWED